MEEELRGLMNATDPLNRDHRSPKIFPKVSLQYICSKIYILSLYTE